jgi:hypothetical protein
LARLKYSMENGYKELTGEEHQVIDMQQDKVCYPYIGEGPEVQSPSPIVGLPPIRESVGLRQIIRNRRNY